jgi:hypothetical protein
MRRSILFVAISACVLLCQVGWGQGTKPYECFPVERLPSPLRARAEAILLQMMDSEALYTVVGGMKPMSGGFENTRIPISNPDAAAIQEIRQILGALYCGKELQSSLLVFHTPVENKRFAEAVVFHTPSLDRMVAHYSEFFAPLGISPGTEPIAIAIAVENIDGSDRHRGLGYLYGYPKPAVDFFVAGQAEYAKSKEITPRDFRQIPTFRRETGGFVYAVPKGTPETDQDRALKGKAAQILAEYRKRRERFVGPGKPGIVALIRDWFSNGRGEYSPQFARF